MPRKPSSRVMRGSGARVPTTTTAARISCTIRTRMSRTWSRGRITGISRPCVSTTGSRRLCGRRGRG
eukprot:18714-Eustigmatos_ZCMA.PRE.1